MGELIGPRSCGRAVDAPRRRAAVNCRAARVTLPRWSELADPARISSAVIATSSLSAPTSRTRNL
jgi:hypothetical protein